MNLGSTFLQYGKGFYQRNWHLLSLTTNIEVLERSLGLCAPVFVCGDLYRSESVLFFSILCFFSSFNEKLCSFNDGNLGCEGKSQVFWRATQNARNGTRKHLDLLELYDFFDFCDVIFIIWI